MIIIFNITLFSVSWLSSRMKKEHSLSEEIMGKGIEGDGYINHGLSESKIDLGLSNGNSHNFAKSYVGSQINGSSDFVCKYNIWLYCHKF